MARVAIVAAFCCARMCSATGASPAPCNTTLSLSDLTSSLWGSSSRYDKRVRPKLAADPPTPSMTEEVFAMLQVFSVLDVDTVHQTFTVEAYIRVIWYDDRLRYAGLGSAGCATELDFFPADLEDIWTPHLVFQNAARPVSTLFDAWWLYPDGMVWWARKVSITLTCKMDFADFPYDIQHCPVQMLAWKTTSAQVAPRFWDPPVKEPGQLRSAGSVEWQLKGIAAKVEDDNDVWGCVTGCAGLVWDLALARKPDYYMKYIVAPNFLLVVMAWSSFWISRAAAPARVTITVVCFLTVTGQISSVMASLPRLDGAVWLLNQLEISRTFVFYSILEFALCNFLTRIETRLESARRACQSGIKHAGHGDEAGSPARPSDLRDSVRDSIKSSQSATYATCMWSRNNGQMILRPHHVDHFSRLVFPVVYAAVVGAYWIC